MSLEKIEVNKTYKNRKLSGFVDWMIRTSGLSRQDIADEFLMTLKTFNNKLYRNQFTVEEVITIAYRCGFLSTILSVDDKGMHMYDLTGLFQEEK